MADLIQFKRASLATWEKLDYVLEPGEPGFVKDAAGPSNFKIGDGVTPWSELPYVGGNIFTASTRYGFPSIGNKDVFYKAEDEQAIYQWHSTKMKYEKISQGINELSIDLIHGGDANGN